jgi:prolyl-tRNA synthetase
LERAVAAKLGEVRKGLYDKALENRGNKTFVCENADEIVSALREHGDGLIKGMWCGDEGCEETIKEKTGVSSRCVPFEQERISDRCVCCQKPADTLVVWGKAY